MSDASPSAAAQTWVGTGVFVVGALMAWGASGIPSDAGYAGVGPNFLPWVVAVVLVLCGVGLVWEARTGGYRAMAEPSGAERGDWRALAWVSAGLLLNAVTITRIGFIFSCTLCFVLAVRGMRVAEGRPGGSLRTMAIDTAVGLALSAPVFWMFTRVLGINLPGITGTGWL